MTARNTWVQGQKGGAPSVSRQPPHIVVKPRCPAISTTAAGQTQDTWEWYQKPGMKPLIIPAGAANGLAFKNVTATAAGTVIIYVEFTETSFL